jgi:hypothetical protein
VDRDGCASDGPDQQLQLRAWDLASALVPFDQDRNRGGVDRGSADSTQRVQPEQSPPAWYVNWDPTSVVTAQGLLSQYIVDFGNQAHTATSSTQFQQILLTIENKVPDLAGWFAPHLLLAGVSLVLILVAALAFKRSRDTLS